MTAIKLKHDQFLKTMMADLNIAKDFFTDHLPDNIQKRINFKSLELQKDSFVEEELKMQFSDILYKVNVDGKESYIYLLLEHQSSIDQLIAYRLWKYIFAIINKHIGKSKARPKLPIILPLVIYNGKAKYTAPRNLWELFEDPELAKNSMASNYLLIDVSKFSDEELKSRKIVGLMEYAMKHIHARDILLYIKNIIEVLRLEYNEELGKLYLKEILCYSISKFQQEEKEELKYIIENNFKGSEDIMGTLVESWKEEGKEEGVKIGREEGAEIKAINIAKKMLSENLSLEVVSKYTELDISTLTELKSQMFDSKFKK